ncbi:MAG: hypothetical protein WC223_13925 [Bacteroidales bacterium]
MTDTPTKANPIAFTFAFAPTRRQPKQMQKRMQAYTRIILN